MNRTGNRRVRRAGGWLRRQFDRRPKPAWMVVVADILLIGIALTVFALFHHVLPRRETSVGLVSSREAAGGSQALIGTTDDEYDSGGDGGGDVGLNLSELSGEDLSFSEDGLDGSADAQAADAMPAETAVPEATPTAEPAADASEAVGDLTADVPGFFGNKFADKFTDGEVVKSKSGYRSKNVNITLKRYDGWNTEFYVADIYVRDITCLVSAFAQGTFGKGIRDRARKISMDIGAVIAINGDFYGARSDGIVIRNGELYRSDKYPDRDVCVLFWDGTMETYGTSKFDAKAAIDAGAYQAWNFGPRLLDSDGKARTHFNSDVWKSNPRTALGYFEPGHYCFVVVDGRQEGSSGLELRELAVLMRDLGCARAYNMDGGNTSVMVAGDRIVNHPSGGGRATSDIIAIVDK